MNASSTWHYRLVVAGAQRRSVSGIADVLDGTGSDASGRPASTL